MEKVYTRIQSKSEVTNTYSYIYMYIHTNTYSFKHLAIPNLTFTIALG